MYGIIDKYKAENEVLIKQLCNDAKERYLKAHQSLPNGITPSLYAYLKGRFDLSLDILKIKELQGDI